MFTFQSFFIVFFMVFHCQEVENIDFSLFFRAFKMPGNRQCRSLGKLEWIHRALGAAGPGETPPQGGPEHTQEHPKAHPDRCR